MSSHLAILRNRLVTRSPVFTRHTLVTGASLLAGQALVGGAPQVGQRVVRVTAHHLGQRLVGRSPRRRRGRETNGRLLLDGGVIWRI